ncbi:unnamed protein product [Rhizoctonia solani]|uniref:Aminotransferase class I/classII large domain-containing protein n=3 Tax=Rhizoctonia solani TaxID=456999 RepID=A0A8H2WH41_9AGAM|nr:aminotransferase class I and protein II [Rhizoctonia solani AG-3 Rhs1AP]KEP45536.1 aminotransferase class I and protein II [Rhizoctonia solani 123E]CAE6380470.1 unnamed protein product [Rhizoctonia solani]CAE6432501.1 unnamed protein product [Rhizoctonia solani]
MAPVSTLSSSVLAVNNAPRNVGIKAHNLYAPSIASLPESLSLTQLARTVPTTLVSKRAAKDDELWPRKLWDSKVSAVIARSGLEKQDCAELRYGNPQDHPIPGIVEVFTNATFPPPGREVDWYAYSVPAREDLEAVAGRLSDSRGVIYHPEDIIVTDGSLTALDLLVYVSTDPGDEVIILSPVYFNYPVIIRHREAVPVIVPARLDNFEPNIEEIRRAITPRTKTIIINSPNNPTGVIYSPSCLIQLSKMLEQVNATRASPILVISDEAYSRIVYDKVHFTSITTIYPYSAMTYTTGKTLLAPGQRLGYIALSSLMPVNHRHVFRRSLTVAQNSTWGFPSSPLLHSLNKLDTMSIDLGRFQARRDFVCDSLSASGFRALRPNGTFYVCVYIPRTESFTSIEEVEEADERFCLSLAEQGVLVMPGALFGWPGTFRISLTANEEQLNQAVKVLAKLTQ